VQRRLRDHSESMFDHLQFYLDNPKRFINPKVSPHSGFSPSLKPVFDFCDASTD
jgi:hypothetical protein